MSTYGNPTTISITFGLWDFGTAGEAYSFKLPAGMSGTLRDVLVMATETFTATTTEGSVEIGSAAGGHEYANCGLGTTADGACYRMSDNSADLVDAYLPADTTIHVTFNAPTGGTPAGMGHVIILVDCYTA